MINYSTPKGLLNNLSDRRRIRRSPNFYIEKKEEKQKEPVIIPSSTIRKQIAKRPFLIETKKQNER